MAVNSVGSTNTGGNLTGSAASLSAFSQNLDSFLTLLTAQLKNQDPLSPLSATEFTTQLVQFAGVEQNIRQSKSLEDLIAIQRSWQAANAVNYIGKTIDANGKNLVLMDGEGGLNYSLADVATSVTVTIKNATGEVVRTVSDSGANSTSVGTHQFVWDGRNNAGVQLPDGVYSFTVEAKNGLNQRINVKTTFSGPVTGVETVNDQIVLQVGSAKVPVSDVVTVRETPSI